MGFLFCFGRFFHFFVLWKSFSFMKLFCQQRNVENRSNNSCLHGFIWHLTSVIVYTVVAKTFTAHDKSWSWHADGWWAQQISDEMSPTFLSTFLLQYSVCSPFAAVTTAHVSGVESIYFLGASTLTLSHDFCSSGQKLSFNWTIELSTLFYNSTKFTGEGWSLHFWRPVHDF